MVQHKQLTFRKSTGLMLFFATLLLIYACNKPLSYKWVYYDETYCSDSWSGNTNNETLKQNVVDYFKTKSIVIYDLEIFADRDVETFNGCSNKTGRRIKCKVRKSDLSKMKSNSFYE